MSFEYLEATTIKKALSLLDEFDGKIKVIAGGTDLLMQTRNKVIAPEYVLDICSIPGLDYIKYDEKNGLAIGACATIKSLETSSLLKEKYPVISQAAGLLGSTAIRNVATVGGNLCNAAPSAETAPAFIGLEATVKISGPAGERIVNLSDFFKGPGKTELQPNEILTEIQVPPVIKNTRGAYYKHSIRGSMDLAIIGVAVITILNGEICEDIRIVLGAVGPTPIRATKAEGILRGKKIDTNLIQKATEMASTEARPISDVRASADYRKHMITIATRQLLTETAGS